MVANLEELKEYLGASNCAFCRLCSSTGNSIIGYNVKKTDFDKNAEKILEVLKQGKLIPGQYTVECRNQKTGKPTFSYYYNIKGKSEPLQEITLSEPINMTPEKELELKEQIMKLQYENEALRRELEEEPLGEEPASTGLAEKAIDMLSEIAVPLINKYFEQRERQIQALEARAVATPAIAPALSPASSFQVSRSYVPKAPSTPATAPGATAGTTQPTIVNVSPGGGGQPQPEQKIPDGITEEEYLEAVKHLTFPELLEYYNQIKNSGKRMEMKFFLAVVKEVRPDDLMKLIDTTDEGSLQN